ncbi:MAG: hypothetical protein JW954_00870 [Dehalococcoidaceae bacterium]|nr:hypothetical protein [Dehalococcoidaceae bacterium]
MDSSRRWLLVFGSIIGALVIATVALVLLTGGNEPELLPENTPEGTVQRYLIAIQEGDYQEAFGYLKFDSADVIKTYEDWLRMVAGYPGDYNRSTWKATLGSTQQSGTSASVEVTIDTFRPGGPFEDPVRRENILFQLTRSGESWLITSPTYIYWNY